MLNLEAVTRARHPLLWVTSEEFYPVAEYFTANSPHPVFRSDFDLGLVAWKQGRWTGILVDDPEDPEVPMALTDLGQQLRYVAEANGILLVENAHALVSPSCPGGIGALVPYLSWLHYTWMEKFMADDASAMAPMVVLVSHSDSVPPELVRLVDHLSVELPSADDLGALVDHFTAKGVEISHSERAALTQAGKGLGQYQFISALSAAVVEQKSIDAEQISRIKVKQLSSGTNLEIVVPKFTLAQVGGLDRAKEILAMNAWMHRHPDYCAANRTATLNRIILLGVPGAGKSLLAEAAAHALGLDLAKFTVGAMMDRWVGSSEANMRAAFRHIRALAPIVLWSDEAGRDLSGGASSASTDGGTTDRVHGTLLTGLNELPDNVFYMGAANSIDALPPEMLRSGRIDQLLFVGFPTSAEREEIFRIHLGEDAERLDVAALAGGPTAFFTGAEIQSLIKYVRFYVVGRYHRPITTSDIMEHIPKLKNRVWMTKRDEVLAMYVQAKTQWSWASTEQETYADQVIEAARAATRRASGAKSVSSMTSSLLSGTGL